MEYVNNMLVLHGGVDIDPSYYGQAPHPKTQTPSKTRDKHEWAAIQDAIQKKIPVVGICRGAQFLCIANGGKLFQHVADHGTSHMMETIDGDSIKTTSMHHQVMDCTGTEHNVLAWAPFDTVVFNGDENGDDFILKNSPEVVWFPKHKHLAIQGHPEWAAGTKYAEYINSLIEKFIGEKGIF